MAMGSLVFLYVCYFISHLTHLYMQPGSPTILAYLLHKLLDHQRFVLGRIDRLHNTDFFTSQVISTFFCSHPQYPSFSKAVPEEASTILSTG